MALLRYLASDILRSQRWMAAFIVYATAVLIINSGGGTLLGTFAAYSAFVLIGSVWITVVALTSEDPAQAQITAVTVGGTTRLRLAKLTTAGIGCSVAAVASAAVPVALHNYSGSTRAGDIAAGIVALIVTVIAGVAIGAVVTRPVIRRSGWTFLVAAVAILADTLVPGAPPTRQILGRFSADHPSHIALFVLEIAVETLLLAAALVAGSTFVAGRRN
jgi:hypothetical protein